MMDPGTQLDVRTEPSGTRALVVLGLALLSSLGAALATVGCSACQPDEERAAEDAGPLEPPPPLDAGPIDAGRIPGPPKRIFAKRFVVNVRERPDRESPRIGYLRVGAVLQATTDIPVGNEGCRGGWYGLTTGGFVCNGNDVIAFEGRRLPERRPAQPDLSDPLPYRYGATRRNNIPMYRRLPSDDEAAVYEGYRIPGYRVELLPDGGIVRIEEAVQVGSENAEASESVAIPEADVQPAVAREPSVEPPPNPFASPTPGAAPSAVAAAPTAAAPSASATEEEEEAVLTLDALAGAREGVVARRLVKGFMVSLDRDMRIGARRYWRTLSNGFVPYFSQVEVNGSEFRGVELAPPERASEPGAMTLPIGFVMSSKTVAYARGRDGRPRRSRPPGYHHVFRIMSREVHREREYLVGPDDVLYLTEDIRILEPHDPPAEVGPEDRWLEVDLERQSLIAYEGRTPVYATLISSGRVRDPDDPLRNMQTPTGLFRITSKHVSHTMDGDHAVDGPYSIEDVPYVMYFQLAYALHSAFWHDGFGRPRSHGCVNLAPQDARWVFNWATPVLPEGWHGAYPSASQPGTWLWIHGQTPEG